MRVKTRICVAGAILAGVLLAGIPFGPLVVLLGILAYLVATDGQT